MDAPGNAVISPPAGPPWRVFLVDDEPLIVELLKNRLQAHGYEVAAAADGVEALEKLPAARPHLIVCDVLMPRMDGFEFCKRLREMNDPTPFLFLTAKGQRQDIIRMLETGADDYLLKPFEAPELVGRIKAILRRSYPSAAR